MLFRSNNQSVVFNNAVKLYSQNEFIKSKEKFKKIEYSDDSILVSKVYFYLGNISFKEENYLDAINNYENCLKINLNSYEAKYNLNLAREKLNEFNKKNENNNNDNNDENSKNMVNEILMEAKQLENNLIKKLNKNIKNKSRKNIKNW